MLKEILSKKSLNRYLPIIGWVKTYRREWLRDDLLSGVVVGMIMIPVAMAYAQMAGVPPQAGLVFGDRRHDCLRPAGNQPPHEGHHQLHHVNHVAGSGRAPGSRGPGNPDGADLRSGNNRRGHPSGSLPA